MSNPDYVQDVLDLLANNWDTNNFSPQPRLIDGDEMRYNDTGNRARNADPRKETLITVTSEPTTQNEPIGTEFNYRHEAGATIRAEGYHTDGGGPLADKDAFDTMYTEARRVIHANRTFPVGEDTWLELRDENDNSADRGDAHYFEWVADVIYHGFETLP